MDTQSASPPQPFNTSPAQPSVGVVLPAGGSGLRLGGERKQYRLLGGAPVLVQTARAFCGHPEVAALVVVAPASDVADVGRMLAGFGVSAEVVAGGATRAASVACGLAALPEPVETVLVHDAVRPFVAPELIARVAAAVRAHGAAAAAVRVSDTLRRGAGDWFAETVERDGMWAMQTPQGAGRDVLRAACAASGTLLGDAAPTDEAGLLARAGTPVAIVEGDTRNVKVTTPADWALACALWPAWVAGRNT